MRILTDEEISEIAISNPPDVHKYGRAIESAVLEKLAGMEMPDPEPVMIMECDGISVQYAPWNHPDGLPLGKHKLFTADQLHQAYAQGAASQLMALPVVKIRTWTKNSKFTGLPEGHAELVDWLNGSDGMTDGEHNLYALKEPK